MKVVEIQDFFLGGGGCSPLKLSIVPPPQFVRPCLHRRLSLILFLILGAKHYQESAEGPIQKDFEWKQWFPGFRHGRRFWGDRRFILWKKVNENGRKRNGHTQKDNHLKTNNYFYIYIQLVVMHRLNNCMLFSSCNMLV